MLGDLMSSVSPLRCLETTRKNYKKIAKQVAQIVEKTEGTADVFDGIVYAGPSISITPNYHNMGLFQLICNFNRANHKGMLLALFRDKTVPIRMIYPNAQNRN
jgi:hypothetical protein